MIRHIHDSEINGGLNEYWEAWREMHDEGSVSSSRRNQIDSGNDRGVADRTVVPDPVDSIRLFVMGQRRYYQWVKE